MKGRGYEGTCLLYKCRVSKISLNKLPPFQIPFHQITKTLPLNTLIIDYLSPLSNPSQTPPSPLLFKTFSNKSTLPLPVKTLSNKSFTL